MRKQLRYLEFDMAAPRADMVTQVKSFCPRKAALLHGYRLDDNAIRETTASRLTRVPIRHIGIGASSGLLLDNFDPALRAQ
jgi:hypothetical protein